MAGFLTEEQIEEIDKKAKERLENEIESIKNELRSFAEDKRSEMSVNVYEYIWGIIQGIDRFLEENKKWE